MGGMGGLGFLIYVVLIVVPFWKIFERTGHPPWLSLLMAVPLVNIGLLYWLAFKEWPQGDRSGG